MQKSGVASELLTSSRTEWGGFIAFIITELLHNWSESVCFSLLFEAVCFFYRLHSPCQATKDAKHLRNPKTDAAKQPEGVFLFKFVTASNLA